MSFNDNMVTEIKIVIVQIRLNLNIKIDLLYIGKYSSDVFKILFFKCLESIPNDIYAKLISD